MRGLRRAASIMLLATVTVAATSAVPAAGKRPSPISTNTIKLRISYIGREELAYSGWVSEAPTGPPECIRRIDGTANYTFAQVWSVTLVLVRRRHHAETVKVTKIEHRLGPDGPGLQLGHAEQNGSLSDCTWDLGQKPDDGTFVCHSQHMRYRHWSAPQLVVEHQGDVVSLLLRSFATTKGSFAGTDDIPTDKSCAHFNGYGGVYGADLFPGDASTARFAMTPKVLRVFNQHNLWSHDVTWSPGDHAFVPEPPDHDCTLAGDHHDASCTLDQDKSHLSATITASLE